MKTGLSSARFYGILDLGYTSVEKASEVTRAMLEGGVQVLQIRAKNQPVSVIAQLAKRLHPLTQSNGVPLIINDYPGLLPEIPCEGVHVGQDDCSVAEAREMAGRPVLVGKSTHSVTQALAAVEEAPDYIGFGPLFATPTKPDYIPVGLEDIREVHHLVPLPVFCIGGVNADTLEQVLTAGAERVVVVSAILKASNIEAYCKTISNRLTRD